MEDVTMETNCSCSYWQTVLLPGLDISPATYIIPGRPMMGSHRRWQNGSKKKIRPILFKDKGKIQTQCNESVHGKSENEIEKAMSCNDTRQIYHSRRIYQEEESIIPLIKVKDKKLLSRSEERMERWRVQFQELLTRGVINGINQYPIPSRELFVWKCM